MINRPRDLPLRLVLFLAIFSVFLLSDRSTANEMSDDSLFWGAVVKPGAFVLIRHALAPGNGDPANFEIGKCSTQRNLSDRGRQQASAIGDMFRSNDIASVQVLSSQWCRCMETARLLDLGDPLELPSLNSFYENFSKQDEQTSSTLAWLEQQVSVQEMLSKISDGRLMKPIVLVTHQVNITALTGVYPGSGEMILARLVKNEVQVIARKTVAY